MKKLVTTLMCALGMTVASATESVKIVIPTAPGGSYFLYAKNLEPLIEKWIDRKVEVDPRPGANGTVAYNHMQATKAHDYMFYLSAVLPETPYNQLTDLQPVIDLGVQIKVVFGHPSFGNQNLKQVLSAAKKPQYTFGILNADAVTPALLAVAPYIKDRTNFVPVVFNKAGDVQQNALGQHIDFGVLGSKVMQPLLSSGQAVPLAVASPYRSHLFPEVPTLIELGYRGPGDQWHNRFVLWATTNVPPAVVDNVRRNWVAFLKTAEGRAFLKDIDHVLNVNEADRPEVAIRKMLSQ